jgi:hypothetical protein
LCVLAGEHHAPSIFSSTRFKNRLGAPWLSVATCASIGLLAYLSRVESYTTYSVFFLSRRGLILDFVVPDQHDLHSRLNPLGGNLWNVSEDVPSTKKAIPSRANGKEFKSGLAEVFGLVRPIDGTVRKYDLD